MPKAVVKCHALSLYEKNTWLKTISKTSPGFYVSAVFFFLNNKEKGEIACNEHFLLFLYGFLPVWRTSVIFIKSEIVYCELFQFENLSFWRLLC